MTRVGIVVVNFNGIDDTIKCCASLLAMEEDPSTVSIVVVDNGSTPSQLREIVEISTSLTVIRNEENLGWSGGNNSGIQLCLDQGCDAVVLLNNDTIVSPKLLSSLREALANNPVYGIIGPVIRFMDEPSVVMTDGVVFNQSNVLGDFFARKAVDESEENEASITPVDIVNGCCLMVRREVFEKIGLIDDRFFLIHEESDFCLRASQVGFKCGVLGRGLVWHKGSSTFKRSASSWQRYYDVRNLGLLLAKHAGRVPNGRGRFQSWIHFFAYVFYLYAKDRQTGGNEKGNIVIKALCDLFWREFGKYIPDRRRLLMGPIKIVLLAVFAARSLARVGLKR